MTMFYLRDSRSNVGSTCQFWAKAGGYTTDLDKAAVYSLAVAQRQYDCRETDVPLAMHLVDEVNTLRVDCQYLEESKAGIVHGENRLHYIHVKGDWDGNDVYWAMAGGSTTNLSLAGEYSAAEAVKVIAALAESGREAVAYSFGLIQDLARRTFQACHVNTRRMTTAAGIRKNHKRIRLTSGLTRGNCPHCGRVTWGGNPYELYTCVEATNEKAGWERFSPWQSCEDVAEYSRDIKRKGKEAA